MENKTIATLDARNIITIEFEDAPERFASVPAVLKKKQQWCTWKYRDGKKLPLSVYGGFAASDNPSTWGSYKAALPQLRRCNGLGYFLKGDGTVFIDLDHCVKDGVIKPWARQIIEKMKSYAEYSPSGQGVHILVKGTLSGSRRKVGSVEIYSERRYFTVTGQQVSGTPNEIKENESGLSWLYPRMAAGGYDFSTKKKSQSEADLAFCNNLARTWNNDPIAIDREFRRSPLMREKWDERHSGDGRTYGEMTIAKALSSKPSDFRAPLRPLSDFPAEKVVWEWEPYIPSGMITIMTGDPGSLKSYLALAICANLTRGVDMTGSSRPAASCIYLTNENDPRKVLRPRFDALGGNAQRLFILDKTEKNGKPHQLSLSDTDMLREMLRVTDDCRVLVIDPIQSYLGSGVDAWRSNQTRPLLDMLGKITEDFGIATILIRHARKSGGSRAIHRGLDSIDFTGTARSELLVGSSADGKERAMIHIKNNVGKTGPAIGFEIRPGGLAGHFKILGQSKLTSADLSAPEKADDSALKDAEEFLSDILSEGSLPFAEIETERKIRGISQKTLQRAKRALGCTSRQFKDKEGQRGWLWALSDGQ